MNPSWQADHGLFQSDTLPKLEQHGKRIGALAGEGNEDAKECIKLYEMLYRSFDPMTHHLLRLRLYKLIEAIEKEPPF